MFGIFKKKRPAASAPVSSGEPFWNEMGMARSIPDYIQLHLASRSPQNTLSRRADGSIEVDAVPPLIFSDPKVRSEISRLIAEQLPNDAAVLSALSSEEIVTRLGGILTKVTGKDMYAIVIRKLCVEHKLL